MRPARAGTLALLLLAACYGREEAGAARDGGASDRGTPPGQGGIDADVDAGTVDSSTDSGVPFDIDAAIPSDSDGGVAPDSDAGDGSDGGAEASLACGTTATFFLPFTEYPYLVDVGYLTVVRMPGYSDPLCQDDKVFVLQAPAGQFQAFSDADPLNCCEGFEYRPPLLVSVCWADSYEVTGAVHGGSSRPLTRLAVCVNDAGVGVTP